MSLRPLRRKARELRATPPDPLLISLFSLSHAVACVLRQRVGAKTRTCSLRLPAQEAFRSVTFPLV